MKRLLLFLTLFISLHVSAQVPQAERDALIDLYNATNGDSWVNNTNWNTELPVSSWHGVTVVNNLITGVSLAYNNLEGYLPNSLTNLSVVESLFLTGNKLEGNLPDFSVIINLQSLSIHANNYDFADLESNFSNNSTISIFNYNPQNRRDDAIAIDGVIGNDYNFSMTSIEGTNVQYQWYKGSDLSGGTPILGATTNVLDLPNIQSEDLDAYICFATSSTIPDLTIKRTTIELKGPVSQAERDALIAFYYATGGGNWLGSYAENWNTAAPVSTWNGVTTTGNKVTGLARTGCNLDGQLPEAIGDLIHLEALYIGLGDLDLTGSIPESIGNLTQLRKLWFQATGMSGELPESIGNLVNLEEIKCLGNNFSGPLPESIGNLTQLANLNLSGNQVSGIPNNSDFSGVLPASIGNLTNLQSLSLGSNSFEGELPVTLSNLNSLAYVDISNNDFTGQLPFNNPNATFNISNNFYDFSDIEPFVQAGNYSALTYSPQRTQDIEEVLETGIGANITLNVNDTNIDRSENDTAVNNIYQWYKDNVVITGANNADYTIINTQVTDSGDYHCEITNTTLPDLTIVRVPITLVIDSNLGVEDNEYEEISIYPNPTKNWLNIKTSLLINAKLSIYDINGRLILDNEIRGNINALNVEELQNGTYILKIEQGNSLISKRFIKQ